MYIDVIYIIYIKYIYDIYIYIYIYIYIKVNYAFNSIHEKAFRSDLSAEIKNTSPLTDYLLRITFFSVIYLYLVALLDSSMIFSFFLSIGVN